MTMQTNEVVTLRELITSGQIPDNAIIRIKDNGGRLIAEGRWYEDRILEHGERSGAVIRTYDSEPVNFVLEPTLTGEEQLVLGLSEREWKTILTGLHCMRPLLFQFDVEPEDCAELENLTIKVQKLLWGAEE